MIKLIASDLDGTLLQDNGTISKETIELIRKAEAQGIRFIVATGRSYNSAKKAIERAGLDVPILCMNGASLFDQAKNLLVDTPIDRHIASEIINATDSNQIYLEMYTDQGIFAPKGHHFLELFSTMLRHKFPDYTEEDITAHYNKRLQEESFIFTDDFKAVLNDPNITTYKLLGFSFDKEKLSDLRSLFSDRNDVYVTSSGFDNVEFNHVEATKGKTLISYADSLGISSEDIMTIGDNENDLTMLTAVKYGVAMGNASEAIKSQVNYVTATNHEDGVKQAIQLALDINNKKA